MNWLLKILGLSADASKDAKPEVKTLDQARGMIAALKAGAEKVNALFTAAALDLDALLTSGEASLKDVITAARAEGSAAVATANARIGQLEADLKAQQDEGAKFKADLDTAKASLASMTAKVTLFEASLAAAGVKLPTATAEKPLDQAAVQGALDARISTKAREKLAAHGHNDPLPVEASADSASVRATGKTMSAAQFAVLSPKEKMEFSRNGGRLTE